MKKQKFRKSRVMPALTVDASTHAALMHAMDITGDSLANLMNQMLVLGLKKYGLNPARFRPDLRHPSDVEKAVNRRNDLKAMYEQKGRFPAFFVSRELHELVRLHQGKRHTSHVMAEALRVWLKEQGPYLAPEKGDRAEPVKRVKRQKAMLMSENPPDLMREKWALLNGVPFSSLRNDEDFA